MKLRIEHIAHHRNGVCGTPFHVVLFRDPDEGRMVGVLFDTPDHLAVFHLDMLLAGEIAFGVNSWRGDHYEPALRQAVRSFPDEAAATDSDGDGNPLGRTPSSHQ